MVAKGLAKIREPVGDKGCFLLFGSFQTKYTVQANQVKVKDNAACPYCQSHRQTIHHLFINCILCIVSWSDGLGAGHLTIIAGNGRRGFFKRKLPAGPVVHLTTYFQMPGGGLELTESHINPLNCSGRSSKYVFLGAGVLTWFIWTFIVRDCYHQV